MDLNSDQGDTEHKEQASEGTPSIIRLILWIRAQRAASRTRLQATRQLRAHSAGTALNYVSGIATDFKEQE